MTNASDNPVYNIALSYQSTAALVAAVKLDVFNLVGAGSNTATLLSAETGASVRGFGSSATTLLLSAYSPKKPQLTCSRRKQRDIWIVLLQLPWLAQ
jgi:hypothetical protein